MCDIIPMRLINQSHGVVALWRMCVTVCLQYVSCVQADERADMDREYGKAERLRLICVL